MRILLTRPLEEAKRSARPLRTLGHDVTVVPLMQVRRKSVDELDLAGADGFILTSQRAAFALPNDGKHRPVFATGARSADAARKRGYKNCSIGGGGWRQLAELITSTCHGQQKKLYHLAGERVRGDLRGVLQRHGLQYELVNVYSIEDVKSPPAGLGAWLADASPGTVLFYSPASADLWQQLGLKGQHLRAVCLSDACREPLDPDDWQDIAIAASPNEPALWQCLDDQV